jgi:hypothetical protein
MNAQAGSFVLLAWALASFACSPKAPVANDIQREEAERRELIEAMENHPAFSGGPANEAIGKPIDVPTTVPPKPPGSTEEHQHHAPPPSKDKG